jgi:hypothetical protein
VGRGGDPRGAMDVDPDVRVLPERSLTRVQPDPHPDPAVLRPGVPLEGELRVDRRRHRLGRGPEHREE